MHSDVKIAHRKLDHKNKLNFLLKSFGLLRYDFKSENFNIVHKLPSDSLDYDLQRVPEYGISCCKKIKDLEYFTLVFTNQDAIREYAMCLYSKDGLLLVFTSHFPLFDCFYNLLYNIWTKGLNEKHSLSNLNQIINRLVSTEMFPPSVLQFKLSLPNNFNLKLRIPNHKTRHFYKFIIEYYRTFDLRLWTYIHLSLLLERSILFYSQRRSRLTAVILAVHSLLYPLSWVHSFYPLIPEDAVEVLESPLPYIAGVHKCLFSRALEHIGHGTLVADLDQGDLFVMNSKTSNQNSYLGSTSHRGSLTNSQLSKTQNSSDGNINTESIESNSNEFCYSIPSPVIHYLETLLFRAESKLPKKTRNLLRPKRVEEQAFNDVNEDHSLSDWINELSEDNAITYSDALTQPFFDLHVNLFGAYCYFVTKESGSHGKFRPEVDVKSMIQVQNAPGLNQFFRMVYDSQMARVFFDNRVICQPDMRYDLFEMTARSREIVVVSNSPDLNSTNVDKKYRMSSDTWPLGVESSKSISNYGDQEWLKCKLDKIAKNGKSASSRIIRRFIQNAKHSATKGFSNLNISSTSKSERQALMEMNANHHSSIAKRLSRTPSLIDLHKSLCEQSIKPDEERTIPKRQVSSLEKDEIKSNHVKVSENHNITESPSSLSLNSVSNIPKKRSLTHKVESSRSNLATMTLNRRTNKPKDLNANMYQYDAVKYKMTNKIPFAFDSKKASQQTNLLRNSAELCIRNEMPIKERLAPPPPPRPPAATRKSTIVTESQENHKVFIQNSNGSQEVITLPASMHSHNPQRPARKDCVSNGQSRSSSPSKSFKRHHSPRRTMSNFNANSRSDAYHPIIQRYYKDTSSNFHNEDLFRYSIDGNFIFPHQTRSNKTFDYRKIDQQSIQRRLI